MDRIVPMSWLNQILLLFSVITALLCLIIQQWAGLTSLPIYVSISWGIFVIILSIWLSCFLLRITLKANSPVKIEFINKWLYKRIATGLKLDNLEEENTQEVKQTVTEEIKKCSKKVSAKGTKDNLKRRIKISSKEKREISDLLKEINKNCVEIWYKNISSDKSFPDEAQELLKKLLTRLIWRINLIDKVKLTHKLANVLLLHLKEYHRALRRVEKGTSESVEEAYKCLHPGSRSTTALEHMLHRLVTVLAQEFLQWELNSSLPCKLLLSILAKKLLLTIETISEPNWIIKCIASLLHPVSKDIVEVQPKQNGTLSTALSDGITSVTAAVIPRPLPKPDLPTLSVEKTGDIPEPLNLKRPTLHLENLTTEHRGLWGKGISETDFEVDEEKISPVYEEATDFATTIARLRSVLQQKSTASTPLHAEEKSYVIYGGSQFINLSIPWTEFHTAPDGSQQLLYCIQFDDVEQRGVDLFETTTATVRRQYSDFAQLHNSLEKIPSLAPIMADLILPEGGRVELENYLKTLCSRLSNECPTELRHFLRPSSSAGKKADVVAPRFDRFLAKTVSGVFNTLKTVVPGFEIEQEEDTVLLPTLMPLADIPWRFVEDIKSKSLALELQQLVAERTEYCTVDTAYEAVDSMESSGDPESLALWWDIVNTSYEEEVDELDSHLSLTSTALDLLCELLTAIASNNTLQQEAVLRWFKLFFGNVTEPLIQKMILLMFNHLKITTFSQNTQTEVSKESIVQLKGRLLETLLSKTPYDLKLIFGEEDTRKILRYLLDLYEIKKINMDLNLQILDVLASQLLVSCRTNHESERITVAS